MTVDRSVLCVTSNAPPERSVLTAEFGLYFPGHPYPKSDILPSKTASQLAEIQGITVLFMNQLTLLLTLNLCWPIHKYILSLRDYSMSTTTIFL
jgi:hypothetical protein